MVIKMKLAEALQERADLNRRIEQLNSRLYRNSKVQQGSNQHSRTWHQWNRAQLNSQEAIVSLLT